MRQLKIYFQVLIILELNTRGGRGKITVFLFSEDHVPSCNWVFENQLIASGILTQPGRKKSNLLADEIGP